MGKNLWVLACVLSAGCSFTFVKEPTEAMLTHEAPLTCTTSRVLPAADLVLGSLLGGAIFGATYGTVDSFNDECEGGCYTPWKPALLAAFLASSPWLISSAVGFSDTHDCRKVVRARRSAP